MTDKILQDPQVHCSEIFATMRASMGLPLQENRVYVWSAILVSVTLLVIFKILYPYPNMVFDSYYYVIAAISRASVSPWAIGYSWFLRAFGFVSHSPLLLVAFQYLLLEASLLVFFLTLTKFFSFSRAFKWLLFAFFFVNPLFLFCANFVMADALFIALSILWVSLLIFMIFRPRPSLIYVHTILILLVFIVRYNALYYPVVATVAFIATRYKRWQKLLGIGLQLMVIAGFIWYTSLQVGAISGVTQFSPFGSWKTANDALYMYGHIYQDDHEPVPGEFAKLHQIVRQTFQANGGKIDDLLDYSSHFYGSVYMFYKPLSPLIRYEYLLYGRDTVRDLVNFKKMAYMGPLYGAYGTWLIRKHPMAFVQYFIGPNVIRYFFPPMEAFSSMPPFFLRLDSLGQPARTWFGLKTITVSWSLIDFRTELLSPYETIAGIIHLIFLFNLVAFFVVRRYRSMPERQLKALAVLLTLWLLDLGFNLTAAATVMRYEIFPLIVEFSLVLWLTEEIYFTRNNT